MTARDPLADRRDRVQRMLRLLRALGANADKIAEVDVTDRDDLRVTQPYDGRMVTLLLGDQNFAVRYQNFLNHYAEIREKMPDATLARSAPGRPHHGGGTERRTNEPEDPTGGRSGRGQRPHALRHLRD